MDNVLWFRAYFHSSKDERVGCLVHSSVFHILQHSPLQSKGQTLPKKHLLPWFVGGIFIHVVFFSVFLQKIPVKPFSYIFNVFLYIKGDEIKCTCPRLHNIWMNAGGTTECIHRSRGEEDRSRWPKISAKTDANLKSIAGEWNGMAMAIVLAMAKQFSRYSLTSLTSKSKSRKYSSASLASTTQCAIAITAGVMDADSVPIHMSFVRLWRVFSVRGKTRTRERERGIQSMAHGMGLDSGGYCGIQCNGSDLCFLRWSHSCEAHKFLSVGAIMEDCESWNSPETVLMVVSIIGTAVCAVRRGMMVWWYLACRLQLDPVITVCVTVWLSVYLSVWAVSACVLLASLSLSIGRELPWLLCCMYWRRTSEHDARGSRRRCCVLVVYAGSLGNSDQYR